MILCHDGIDIGINIVGFFKLLFVSVLWKPKVLRNDIRLWVFGKRIAPAGSKGPTSMPRIDEQETTGHLPLLLCHSCRHIYENFSKQEQAFTDKVGQVVKHNATKVRVEQWVPKVE